MKSFLTWHIKADKGFIYMQMDNSSLDNGKKLFQDIFSWAHVSSSLESDQTLDPSSHNICVFLQFVYLSVIFSFLESFLSSLCIYPYSWVALCVCLPKHQWNRWCLLKKANEVPWQSKPGSSCGLCSRRPAPILTSNRRLGCFLFLIFLHVCFSPSMLILTTVNGSFIWSNCKVNH